jgi:predicted O-methyltransferase YrrM
MGAFDGSSAWRSAAQEYHAALRQLIDIEDVNCIVEIGVDFGFSFFTLAKDFPKARVIGIDAYVEYMEGKTAKEHVQRHLGEFKNASLIVADSIQIAKAWLDPSNYLDIDILHIDGDHSPAGSKADFENWLPYVIPGGVVMFHDINAFPQGPGKLFSQLDGTKIAVDNTGPGLGLWVKP